MHRRTKLGSRSRNPVAVVMSEAGTWGLPLATTAALAVIGWLGHATHWSFGLAGHGGVGRTARDAASAAAATPGFAPPSTEEAIGGVQAPEGRIRFRSQEALERTGIELVAIEQRPMVSELVVNGVVAYDERRIAQLSARVSGSIWRVEKHLGDQVRRGDVLLVVDSQDVGRLKSEFLNALVANESRREQLAILEEVKGAVMGRQLREARAALRESRNHLMLAEQALVNLGFEITVADYSPLDDDARVSRIRSLGIPPAIMAGLGGDRLTSNLLPLYAPFDGVVVGRQAVVGEVIEAARPIIEVADVSTMLLALEVSKEDAAKVAIGQPVTFRPDGSVDEYASRITWISTEVNEETRTLQVRAEVRNVTGHSPVTAAGLRANTFGSGRIEIDRRSSAVVVPTQSVQWDGSRWVVFVPSGDASFEPRPVQPGVQAGDVVEIVTAPADGTPFTHVVSAGSHVLKSQILLERMERGEL